LQTEIEDIFIREARKKNNLYQRVAIELLGQVFAGLKSERFGDINDYLVQVILECSVDEFSMELDEDRVKPMMLAIQANAFKAIGLSFCNTRHMQGIIV
jgi:hypothetical protein